jgi:hypothetical protein
MSVFSHAGVSKLNGEFKVRFANDALRVKVLAKNGHKDIDIVELKTPMTKEAAVAYLLSIDFANGNKAVQSALNEAAGKRGVKDVPTMAKIEAKVKAKKTTVADAVMAEAKAKADAEPTMTVKEANARLLKQLADKYPEDAPF